MAPSSSFVLISAIICVIRIRGELIKLNIGGEIRIIEKDILIEIDVVNQDLFGGFAAPQMVGDAFYINEDAKYFELILNYVRAGKIRHQFYNFIPESLNRNYAINRFEFWFGGDSVGSNQMPQFRYSPIPIIGHHIEMVQSLNFFKNGVRFFCDETRSLPIFSFFHPLVANDDIMSRLGLNTTTTPSVTYLNVIATQQQLISSKMPKSDIREHLDVFFKTYFADYGKFTIEACNNDGELAWGGKGALISLQVDDRAKRKRED